MLNKMLTHSSTIHITFSKTQIVIKNQSYRIECDGNSRSVMWIQKITSYHCFWLNLFQDVLHLSVAVVSFQCSV